MGGTGAGPEAGTGTGTGAGTGAEPGTEDRRGALRLLVTLGGAVYAGALAVPAAAFLAPPDAGGARARWVRVGRLADLPAGRPVRLVVVGDQRDAFTVGKDERLGAVWAVREGEGVRVLSAACPHLGCAVELAPEAKGFACPCHSSAFDLAGKPLAGPSPRALDPLVARVVDGFVEVDFRRFRTGVAERREVAG